MYSDEHNRWALLNPGLHWISRRCFDFLFFLRWCKLILEPNLIVKSLGFSLRIWYNVASDISFYPTSIVWIALHFCILHHQLETLGTWRHDFNVNEITLDRILRGWRMMGRMVVGVFFFSSYFISYRHIVLGESLERPKWGFLKLS